LVVGDAACVDADVAAALEMFEPDAIAATNNMIIRWPSRLDYAITLHPAPCANWPGIHEAIRRRRQAGKNLPETWTYKRYPRVDRYTSDWAGSTGLLCVKVLLEEGFSRIILAGVPMSADQAHFYEAEAWRAAPQFHRGWRDRLPIIRDKVRSMSGWTRELLGVPTPEWLSV